MYVLECVCTYVLNFTRRFVSIALHFLLLKNIDIKIITTSILELLYRQWFFRLAKVINQNALYFRGLCLGC